jgi:hypothetical protein
MKRSVFALSLVLVFVALFSSCSLLDGKSGNAYLDITCPSGYSFYANVSPGLGFPDPWYGNTSYLANSGTWSYYYAIASYFGTSGSGYLYSVNAVDNALGQYGLAGNWYDTNYSTFDAAYDAFSNGYYFSGSMNISTNPGVLFSNGADRNYTLVLGYDYGSSYIFYAGVKLPSKVLADNDVLTVMQFRGAKDTITLTLNKRLSKSPSDGATKKNAMGFANAASGSEGMRVLQ